MPEIKKPEVPPKVLPANSKVPEVAAKSPPEIRPLESAAKASIPDRKAGAETKGAVSEGNVVKPGKPPIVLLPPLTPPVFAKPEKKTAAAPPSPSSEPDADPPEETRDLVVSEKPPSRPPPGDAPMAPRTALDSADGEESAGEEPAEIAADDQETESDAAPLDDAAAQKAKAARLGKKLRRKATAKEQPPIRA
jgi:hypothetical protein